jgi:hypothetical protein
MAGNECGAQAAARQRTSDVGLSIVAFARSELRTVPALHTASAARGSHAPARACCNG